MPSRIAKSRQIASLYEELVAHTDLPLYTYRKDNGYMPVIGDGDPGAHILFVGEAPGKTEAETGKPFQGRSGKMLDTLLMSVGLDRKQIYISNVVNDRPPENRDPTDAEVEMYGTYLQRLISIIKPKVIVPLGRISMKYIFSMYGVADRLNTIGELHGKAVKVKGVDIIPLYHPAVALYNGSKKQLLMDDFKILRQYLV